MIDESKLTKLEKGIVIRIDPYNFEILTENLRGEGFLDYECYPDYYKEISLPREVGRFLMFRFILDEK